MDLAWLDTLHEEQRSRNWDIKSGLIIQPFCDFWELAGITFITKLLACQRMVRVSFWRSVDGEAVQPENGQGA